MKQTNTTIQQVLIFVVCLIQFSRATYLNSGGYYSYTSHQAPIPTYSVYKSPLPLSSYTAYKSPLPISSYFAVKQPAASHVSYQAYSSFPAFHDTTHTVWPAHVSSILTQSPFTAPCAHSSHIAYSVVPPQPAIIPAIPVTPYIGPPVKTKPDNKTEHVFKPKYYPWWGYPPVYSYQGTIQHISSSTKDDAKDTATEKTPSTTTKESVKVEEEKEQKDDNRNEREVEDTMPAEGKIEIMKEKKVPKILQPEPTTSTTTTTTTTTTESPIVKRSSNKEADNPDQAAIEALKRRRALIEKKYGFKRNIK